MAANAQILDKCDHDSFGQRSVRAVQVDLVKAGDMVTQAQPQEFQHVDLAHKPIVRHAIQRENVDPEVFLSRDQAPVTVHLVAGIHNSREIIMVVGLVAIRAQFQMFRKNLRNKSQKTFVIFSDDTDIDIVIPRNKALMTDSAKQGPAQQIIWYRICLA